MIFKYVTIRTSIIEIIEIQTRKYFQQFFFFSSQSISFDFHSHFNGEIIVKCTKSPNNNNCTYFYELSNFEQFPFFH